MALVSLVASALLVEGFLRRYNPIDSILYEMHPRYLFRLVPGARRIFFRTAKDGGAARILVTVNGLGFRGPEIRAKPGSRIVVYGDSFVMAALTPLEETFATRLEASLRGALHRPFEVVNAGVVGYGPDQVSLRVEDEISTLHPDLVIVALYSGNDFGDLLRNKIFRLEPDGTLAVNPYRLSAGQIERFPDQPAKVPWSMLVRGLSNLLMPPGPPRHDTPYRRGRERVEDTVKRYLNNSRLEYKFRGTSKAAEVDNLFGDTYSADLLLTPDEPSARYAAGLMERVLVRIAALGAARGVPVLFLILPDVRDVCAEGAYAEWKAAVREFPAYRSDRLTNLLADLAARNGLEHLDLFPAFASARPCSLFFPRDGHWNGAGQALAAELVRNHAIVRGLIR